MSAISVTSGVPPSIIMQTWAAEDLAFILQYPSVLPLAKDLRAAWVAYTNIAPWSKNAKFKEFIPPWSTVKDNEENDGGFDDFIRYAELMAALEREMKKDEN